jgi:glutamate/aspartate transport system substrate-binding protein
MAPTRVAILGSLGVASILFAAVTNAAAQTKIPSDSRLYSVATTGVIKIAHRTDARPFSFVNDYKEPVGYTIDLCVLVAKSIGQRLNRELKIEWIPVTTETRFSIIADATADMECGSSTVSLSRMEEVDFSIFDFVESTSILVKRGSNIHSLSDMTGRRIAVISGTTNEKAVAYQLHERKLDSLVVSVGNREEGMRALEEGKVDGLASDTLLLIGAQMKHPEELVLLADDLSIEQYAIVLPRGDWAFRLAVNVSLARIFRSGQIVEVFAKWFGQYGIQPGVLLNAVYALGKLPD